MVVVDMGNAHTVVIVTACFRQVAPPRLGRNLAIKECQGVIKEVAIKEGIEFDGKQDLRTKEEFAAAKAKGVLWCI